MAYIQSKNPFKQKSDQVVIDGKTYPKGYTEEDVKFLKEQKEDVVRREELDDKGKALYDKIQARNAKQNESEGFMQPPYRSPEGKGPRAKRQGYHGYRKKDDSSPVNFVSAAQRKAVWASKNEKK